MTTCALIIQKLQVEQEEWRHRRLTEASYRFSARLYLNNGQNVAFQETWSVLWPPCLSTSTYIWAYTLCITPGHHISTPHTHTHSDFIFILNINMHKLCICIISHKTLYEKCIKIISFQRQTHEAKFSTLTYQLAMSFLGSF